MDTNEDNGAVWKIIGKDKTVVRHIRQILIITLFRNAVKYVLLTTILLFTFIIITGI
jgi:small-conductance mechanosensitive channel